MSTSALNLVGCFVTQSVRLLSDAMESGVDIVEALMVLAVLNVAARPPDEDCHSICSRLTGGVK